MICEKVSVMNTMHLWMARITTDIRNLAVSSFRTLN